MITIQPNSTKQEKFTGTYNAIIVMINVAASVANTALVNSDFNAKNVFIKIELVRNGEVHTLLNSSLDIIGVAATIDNAQYYSCGIGSDNRYNLTTVAAAGVKERGTINYYLPFSLQMENGQAKDGHVNLNDATNDYLQLTVIGTPGMFSSAIDLSTSNITITMCESIGLEYATPKIEQIVINSNVDSQSYDLGDLVNTVRFVNFDKTGITNALQVLQMVNLNSDKIVINGLTYEELLLRRMLNYISKTEANDRYQSFKLIDEKLSVNKCKLDLSFNDANVNSSNNYIVVGRYVKNPKKAIESVQKKIIHDFENKTVLGLPTTPKTISAL